MGRPIKDTVDYFPHDCNTTNKKTIYILEQKYGNNGYAFWFKLLEMLGSAHNHHIKLGTQADKEFMSARMRLDWGKCKEILNLLADLDAISKPCWKKEIIYSPNFVERLRPLYEKRKRDLPTFNCIKGSKKPVKGNKNPVNGDKKPESKEKKVEKKKYMNYVYLTDEEYQKLIDKFGITGTGVKIERLDIYLESLDSKGKKDPYKSHYKTILNWDRRDQDKKKDMGIYKGNKDYSDSTGREI